MNKIYLMINAFLLTCNIFAHYNCDTTIVSEDTLVACTTFFKNGKLSSIDSFLNSQMHGKQIEWYENGNIKSILNCQNGKTIDTIYTYYENRRIKSIIPQNGISVKLSKSGDTLSITNFQNGKRYGKAYSYYENRKRKYIHYYNDSGQKHGLCESWREDGTRKDSIVYHNGNIIELRAYFLNGKVRHWIKKVDKDSYKTLEAFYYDTSGAVCGEVKNGNGNFISWSDNYENRWLKSYKDGEEVASRELEPDENPDWK
ncbi:MAG: hypothetical protein GXY77_11275 [Fibrobacter sp.]|nr:hypothetical protein [Fibrobacter sp.]